MKISNIIKDWHIKDIIGLDLNYCVYITHYTGNKLPPFYVGHTSLKQIDNGYNGTVTSQQYGAIWKLERKNHPELFRTYMLSKHQTELEANLREGEIHRALDVVASGEFINMAYAQKNFFFGGKHTEDAKRRISEGVSKRVYSIEDRMRMSIAQKNRTYWPKASLEARAKMSITRKSRKQTPDFIEKRIAPQRGKSRASPSQETRAKLALANLGKTYDDDFKNRVISGLRNSRGYDYILTRGSERFVTPSLKDFCQERALAYSSIIACFRSKKIHRKSGWFVSSLPI